MAPRQHIRVPSSRTIIPSILINEDQIRCFVTTRKYPTSKQKCPSLPVQLQNCHMRCTKMRQKTHLQHHYFTGFCTSGLLHWLKTGWWCMHHPSCQNIWTPEFPPLGWSLNLVSFLLTQCWALSKSSQTSRIVKVGTEMEYGMKLIFPICFFSQSVNQPLLKFNFSYDVPAIPIEVRKYWKSTQFNSTLST